MIALWVGVGAAIGAPLRYLTDWAMQRRFRQVVPVGTLAVNLAAALVLGLLAGVSGLHPALSALVGTGFCGALSTWSTFAFEVVELGLRRERVRAAAYLAITVVAGITSMARRRFFVWSAVGALLWVLAITLLGYFLGRTFPALGDNIDYAVIAIALFTVLPLVFEALRHRRHADDEQQSDDDSAAAARPSS